MVHSNPLVSIVIPFHERPMNLDKVLTAYEMQSYKDIEVIVVGDGCSSREDLLKVTEKHNVRVYRNPHEHRYGHAALCRNIGAARAEGDILVFSDVDVIPESEAVTRIANAQSESLGLIFCGRIHRITGGLDSIKTTLTYKQDQLEMVSKPMEYDPNLQWSRVGSIHKSEFWWAFISGLCSFRRGDYFSLVGWDPGYFGWGYEDTDMGYRILRHRLGIAFFDDIIGFHIDHASEDKIRDATALGNLNYFTDKFPELKSFPILVKRRRELENATQAWKKVPKDPLLTGSYSFGLRRFLEHPNPWDRTISRKRESKAGSIAVVIPTRNRSRYLEEAVLSCIHQTRPPHEVFIVVDPSGDGTDALAQELARKFAEVQCIFNGKNRGVAESRNQGIVASQSEYVMFLDSDDVLSPSYFEKVARLLDKDSHVGLAYSSYVEFGDRDRTVRLPAFALRVFLVDCITMGPAMARRCALEDAGGFDPKQVFEDWELWMRVIKQGWGARGVEEPLYHYRVHQGNRDKESNLRRKEGEDLIYMKHRELYDRHGIGRTADGRWTNAPAYQPFR